MNDNTLQDQYDELVSQLWKLIDDSVGRLAVLVIRILNDLIRSVTFEKMLEQMKESALNFDTEFKTMERARAEVESVERAQQREDQLTHSLRVKATIKHHCKAHYSTSRKASHRPRNRI